MKTNLIKQLAQNLTNENQIDKKTADFVLEKLTKSELKTLLHFLKRENSKKTLYVTSASDISEKMKKNMLKLFDKENFSGKVDKSIGAGVVIKNNDDIIDLSVIGEIKRFTRQIS